MFRKGLRIAASLGIFALVLVAVDPREVINGLQRISPLYVIATLGIVVIDSLLRSANWRQLLNRFVSLDLKQTWLAYLSGAFYGSIIPSTVGTDVARAIAITQRVSIDMRISVATLVTLNILGLGAVGALGFIATVALLSENQTTFLILDLCLSGSLVLVAGVLLFAPVGRWLIERVAKVAGQWLLVKRFLDPLMSTLLVLPRAPRDQIVLAGIAFGNQLIRVSVTAVAAVSLGLDIDWWIFAAIAPLLIIVSMVPMSILGIGIEQGATVVLLAQFGVAGSDAFAISITVASVYIALALSGGIVVILETALKPRQRPADQSDTGIEDN